MAEAETSLFHKGVAFLSSVNPFTGRRHSGSNFSHSIERIDEGATPTPSLKAEDNLPQPLRRSRSLDARSSVEEREVLAVVTPSPFDIPNSPPPRAPSRGTYLDASNFIFPKSAANQIDGAATETDAINAPNSPALPKVLPADDVSSHVMCYLFLPGMLPDSPEPGDPDYIPTKERHKALLPSELFVDMYKDFSRRRGFEPTLGLSHQDMYAIFSTVVLDYGSALDEAHSNIDWSSLCIKLGLSDSIANNMVEIYLRQLAPLVALWLAQIRLRECFSDLELEVSLQAWDLATRRLGPHTSLERAKPNCYCPRNHARVAPLH
ncbi:hypothetical protein DL93DRAFT_1648638 [Clavulina sp. PMI_390]|nr:hypothetical protein DL93DRAFT_1648638 [Clavulina sp. PMI_390]